MTNNTAIAPPAADVAVIIPAHRCAAELTSALASVAAQTLPPMEVIVADDASGDDTATVARSWRDRLPLRVVELDHNRGPAGARRAAIEHATAPRLALLDADDVWLPDHLRTMVDLHDRCGGLVTADYLRWIPGAALATTPAGRRLPVPRAAEQRAAILDHDFVFVGSLFTRADHDAAGGFREQFRGPEDWDLWIRMVRNGVVVHRPDHPTVLYRLRTGSVSSHTRMVEQERAVVRNAIEESRTVDDRARLGRTLRRVDAKAALYDSYDLARRGRPWAARRRALGGLRGPGRVPIRAVALALAPTTVTRVRDDRARLPRWWLRV